MSLKDPVAVYNAANNVEAQMIRLALIAEGIEAFVTEDISTAGFWMFGLLPEIHKPQVWAERGEISRVKPVLDEYERQAALRRQADAARRGNEPPVEATCEECGQTSEFPAVQRGTVQSCPHCGQYMDIESKEALEAGDWQTEGVDE